MRLSTDRDNKLRKWFSVKDTAAAFGVSINTVRALISRKELSACCLAGHTVRIPADDIERFLRARTMGRPFHAPLPSDASPTDSPNYDRHASPQPRPRRRGRRPPKEPLASAA